jgi:hypothetical protein
MTDKTKYLVVGGLALAGVGYWWYTHQQASSEIVSQPVVPKTSLPTLPEPVVGIAVVSPVGTATTATGQDQTQLNALLSWAGTTKNPSLYGQMIAALTPSQLSALYDILTTDWEGSGKPTAAQTSFWNGLVAAYPFLRSPNPANCNNFTCT